MQETTHLVLTCTSPTASGGCDSLTFLVSDGLKGSEGGTGSEARCFVQCIPQL